MEMNIPNALRRLRTRLDRLRELLEWKKLKDAERPIEGLGMRRPDPAREEIAAAFAEALTVANEVQDGIDGYSGADARERFRWQAELRSMVLELADLNPTNTFINR